MPAATPVLLNVAMIGGVWALAPLCERWGMPPIYALAAGVMIGGVLQLAVQIPALRAGRLPAAHPPRLRRPRRGLAPPGRAPGDAADGAGAARRLGGADLGPDQHADRLAPGRRRGVLARLRRPADGIPDRAARRRRRRGADPAALGGARPRGRRRLFRDARLGPAPDADARPAVQRRPAGVSRAAGGDAVPARPVRRPGGRQDGARPARLRPAACSA